MGVAALRTALLLVAASVCIAFLPSTAPRLPRRGGLECAVRPWGGSRLYARAQSRPGQSQQSESGQQEGEGAAKMPQIVLTPDEEEVRTRQRNHA
jgi:hypothetical protein